MRRSDQRRAAIFAGYQADVTARPLEELLAGAKTFTRELAEGVAEHRDELDAEIGARSRGWSISRIAPLERNILRVGLYEMRYRDLPPEIAIDEAVNTAKEYCGTEAPSFVNGILGALAREEVAGRE